MATLTRDDGVRIYFEDLGGAGEPVLFVMGLGGDAHLWEKQVPAFTAAGYRVLLLDNRGMGRSDKPKGPYSVEMLAGDALAVLDAAGVAKAHVVGYSLGGMIAQRMAIDAPSRVTSLVLVGTAARVSESAREHFEGAVMKRLLGAGDLLDLLKYLTPLVYSAEWLAKERDWLKAWTRQAFGYGIHIGAYEGQIAAALGHDARAQLAKIRVPTLILEGTKDALLPPTAELAAGIAGSRVSSFEGASHGFPMEEAERFNREVIAFLGSSRGKA